MTASSLPQRQASPVLLQMIDDALYAAELTLSDLGGLVVNRGPGSYTGIRVGLATATGLALASGLPTWTASSLELLARSALRGRAATDGSVLAIVPARRDIFVAREFSGDNPGVPLGSAFRARLSELTERPQVTRIVSWQPAAVLRELTPSLETMELVTAGPLSALLLERGAECSAVAAPSDSLSEPLYFGEAPATPAKRRPGERRRTRR